MIDKETGELLQYGVKRRSGRYPYGSGGEPFQHSGDFLSRLAELSSQGLSEKDQATALGLSVTDLRMQARVAKHEQRELKVDRAKSMRDDGLSLQEIANEMGFANDSSVRALLDARTANNKNQAKATAEILKKELDKKGMLDVGVGVERDLGISSNTLKEALFTLQTEGLNVYGVGIPQVTNPGKQIVTTVLTPGDVEYGQVYKNIGDIMPVSDYHSLDGGVSWSERKYPASISKDRISICYAEDGGTRKDGVIELRRGVPDIDLGKPSYAQVRIMVDDSHYLKGMAMYSDDIPDGKDIVFNTNKTKDVPFEKVLKAKKADPDNPFGAFIKANGQSEYTDPKTGERKLSVINKLKEEGDWDEMAKNISSQFLSKQKIGFIQKQLNITYDETEMDYAEIKSLTNPTLRKKMLLDFANEADTAACHLKSAALPRQRSQVLLPLPDMKTNEVYAPNFNNGEKVVLVRFPHGGTFELPELTVNNRNRKAISILGKATDAVGINPTVANQLSGADFDGDHVTVIPVSDKVKISVKKPLSALLTFDAKTEYANRPGMKVMAKKDVQKQMGMISNLITDMTLRGAVDEEITRAVKHSMVVIDAEKHKLDYIRSEKENGIPQLKAKYQGHVDLNGDESGGASTLLSRRKQNVKVPETRGSGIIDKKTGEVIYKETGRTYVDPKTGKLLPAKKDMAAILYVDDVNEMSSGTIQERAYADYANRMKALANEARKEYANSKGMEVDSNAKVTYAKEVESLYAKLDIAARNAPKERRAQAIANAVIKAKVIDNNITDKAEKRKLAQNEITNARIAVGASGKEKQISIDDREWEAIQKGALSDSKLAQIFRFADQEALKERALPKTTLTLTPAKFNKMQTMYDSGNYTYAEIAKAIGVSLSTVKNNIER